MCIRDSFYVQDIVQNKYWVCSVESLKNNKPCVLSSFNYSKDVISVCPLDSTYVGLDFWYIDIPEYNNGIESPLTFFLVMKTSQGIVQEIIIILSQMWEEVWFSPILLMVIYG